jgi:hypothetical protein
LRLNAAAGNGSARLPLCLEATVRVEIRAAPENARSRAIPERLGFIQEGTLRQVECVRDRYLDNVVYADHGDLAQAGRRRRAEAVALALDHEDGHGHAVELLLARLARRRDDARLGQPRRMSRATAAMSSSVFSGRSSGSASMTQWRAWSSSSPSATLSSAACIALIWVRTSMQ